MINDLCVTLQTMYPGTCTKMGQTCVKYGWTCSKQSYTCTKCSRTCARTRARVKVKVKDPTKIRQSHICFITDPNSIHPKAKGQPGRGWPVIK